MKKNKRILIITDSISMPRPEVPYEKTWLYFLKQEFADYDFIDRPARGSTSTRLVTEGGGGIDLLESYHPDIVILQIGITECAPRLFKKPGLEYYLVSRIMPDRLRARYINLVKKRRGRKPHITDVSPKQFKENITSYFNRAKALSTEVIVILINPPTTLFTKKSPHINENIIRYNSIYRDVSREFDNVRIIDPLGNCDDIDNFSLDELHIGPQGSEMIFNALRELLHRMEMA